MTLLILSRKGKITARNVNNYLKLFLFICFILLSGCEFIMILLDFLQHRIYKYVRWLILSSIYRVVLFRHQFNYCHYSLRKCNIPPMQNLKHYICTYTFVFNVFDYTHMLLHCVWLLIIDVFLPNVQVRYNTAVSSFRHLISYNSDVTDYFHYVSDNATIFVRFVSNWNVTRRGFQAKWTSGTR